VIKKNCSDPFEPEGSDPFRPL